MFQAAKINSVYCLPLNFNGKTPVGCFSNQQDNKIKVFIYMQYGIEAMAGERPL